MQAGRKSGNEILDAIPPAERRPILDAGRCVHLTRSEILFRQAEPIAHVHFPVTAVVSLVTLLRDGSTVGTSIIGCEGTTAVPLLLGMPSMPNLSCICHVGGEAIALPARVFAAQMQPSSRFRAIGLQYVAAVLAELGQGVACSRLHNTTSRCARWLLMTHDRVRGDEIRVTHELVSFMLGTRRASVSEALEHLAAVGLIRTHHGTIEIVDRAGLESVACECYSIIRDAA